MNWNDVLAPFVQVFAIAVSTVLAGLLAVYVPRAIAAFEKRTGIQLTEQQRTAVLGAVDTAAGILKTKLDQGIMRVQDVHSDNPVIKALAADALKRVPNSAVALGTTAAAMAEMVVGKVDTSPKAVAPVI